LPLVQCCGFSPEIFNNPDNELPLSVNSLHELINLVDKPLWKTENDARRFNETRACGGCHDTENFEAEHF